MSFDAIEDHRDLTAGLEYEEYRGRVSGDLCELCGNDLVVEGEDFCRSCITDIFSDEIAVREPDHPRHHEIMSDLWDNREKVA